MINQNTDSKLCHENESDVAGELAMGGTGCADMQWGIIVNSSTRKSSAELLLRTTLHPMSLQAPASRREHCFPAVYEIREQRRNVVSKEKVAVRSQELSWLKYSNEKMNASVRP